MRFSLDDDDDTEVEVTNTAEEAVSEEAIQSETQLEEEQNPAVYLN